jgi:uncharacterized protein
MKNNYWIQTYSGRKFSLTDPQPEDIVTEDVLISLSRINRFTGHTLKHAYTVAQHTVLVSHLVDNELFAGDGLVHDYHEAVIGDISSPLKAVIKEMAGLDWNDFEHKIVVVFAERFGVDRILPPRVKHADLVSLATEKRDLLAPEPEPWIPLPEPAPYSIPELTAEQALGLLRWRHAELVRAGLVKA